tara:strand:- start:505 stop:915 length:411 start_codon:yes stop_codon:yes gene_type:complete
MVPINIYAQTPKISYLKTGTRAPFAGYLYNPEAQAEFESKLNLCEQSCELGIGIALRKQEAKHTLEVEILRSEFKISEQKNKDLLALKEGENKRLVKAYEKKVNQKDYNVLYAIGGYIAGVATAILIFYASVKVAQ